MVICPLLELRHIWAWMRPSGEVGLWGWFAGGLGDLCYCRPGDPTLSPAPPPHVYALRKGGLRRSSSCFHKVFAESRPSLGAWMTKHNWAEERVTIPTSVQSTAWFWNAGVLKGTQSRFGTLKGCITGHEAASRHRGPAGPLDSIGGGSSRNDFRAEGRKASLEQKPGSKKPWEAGRDDGLYHSWPCMRQTSRNNQRGPFWGFFFGGGVVVLHKQVALRIIFLLVMWFYWQP